ncbi:MAG: HAD hydrolase family protein, partial [Clostridia bacterium]|nr:HAD hydrolase family protein [Clostridia bacterium]
MIPVQMAVFDLDGTLLEHGALTSEAVQMLRALRQRGVVTVIATGRHRGTVPLRLKNARLIDYLICSNGAVVT